MRLAYIGNFEPPHSTENHIARALRNNGHEVHECMERPWTWDGMATRVQAFSPDFILWTSTNDYAPPETFGDQLLMLAAAKSRGVPVVGYHLDLWWGINREHFVHEKPFFKVDLLCTADGGHQDEWASIGVDHAWFPPAISEGEAKLGSFRAEYDSDIAFVGSWRGGYHPESTHRAELVRWLKLNYGERCRFWPEPGQRAIRGRDLQDLYASVDVVVGDSCMVPHLKRYWSDRVPETTGRGAFLLHPTVDGLAEMHPHLKTWAAGCWGQLEGLIDNALADDKERRRAARLCREETILNHTYEHRMKQLIDEMKRRGLL